MKLKFNSIFDKLISEQSTFIEAVKHHKLILQQAPDEDKNKAELEQAKAEFLASGKVAKYKEPNLLKAWDKYLKSNRIPYWIFHETKKKNLIRTITKADFDKNPKGSIDLIKKNSLVTKATNTSKLGDLSADDKTILKEYRSKIIPVIALIRKKSEAIATGIFNKALKQGIVVTIEKSPDGSYKINKTVKIEDFLGGEDYQNVTKYEEVIKSATNELKMKANDEAKKDTQDSQAVEFENFKQEAVKLETDMPMQAIAKACDTPDAGGADLYLRPCQIYDLKGNKVGEWDNGQGEIDSPKQIEKFYQFLCSKFNKKSAEGNNYLPVHPRSFGAILTTLITNKDAQEAGDEDINPVIKTWADKANQLADKYKQFDINPAM